MDNQVSHLNTPRTRLMLVEDQTSIREMLSEVLSRMPEFQVVAEAADLDEALRLAACTQPDIIILDWCFPGGGGGHFLHAMRDQRIHSHIIILTGHTTEEAVDEALQYGVRGFFEKTGNLTEFFQALRAVKSGGAYFGPEASAIVEHLLKEKHHGGRDKAPGASSEGGFLGGAGPFQALGCALM